MRGGVLRRARDWIATMDVLRVVGIHWIIMDFRMGRDVAVHWGIHR